MRRPQTRRTLLATLGAVGTFSIAGCSGVISPGPDESDQPAAPGTTDRPGTDTPGGPNTPQGPGGSVIDDFEGTVQDRWAVNAGKFITDTKQPHQGKQSLVLEGGNNGKDTAENSVSITRSFFDSEGGGLDLASHDLSMAVRFEQPARGRIAVECIGLAESNKLTSRRFIPKELNGWTRFDLGYTGKNGKPTMKKIQELRISVTTQGEPIKVGIDDLRKIPKANKGKVMFQFDDSVISTYTKAFPELQKRGWKAGVAVIPVSIGTEGNLKAHHMREMGKAGWDMMSHPPAPEPYPEMSKKDQETKISDAKQSLTQDGFDRGVRHIVAPYGRVNRTTLEIIRKHHKANYMFGGTPVNAKRPSNMYTIPRVMGKEADAVTKMLDTAEQYNQLVVIQYHRIGVDGAETSMADFKAVLDHVEKKDMDVISPSEFLDSM